MSSEQPAYHAWNPGLTSDIPGRLKPLITLFRPENARVGYDEAREAAEFCGLKPVQLYALRPERLIAHELLIRVTADLSVQDGPTYEVLGRNLRPLRNLRALRPPLGKIPQRGTDGRFESVLGQPRCETNSSAH